VDHACSLSFDRSAIRFERRRLPLNSQPLFSSDELRRAIPNL
jgi:hypothetical protein